MPEPVRGRYWELLAHVSGMVDARDPERAEAAWLAYRLLLSQMMAAVKRRATVSAKPDAACVAVVCCSAR